MAKVANPGCNCCGVCINCTDTFMRADVSPTSDGAELGGCGYTITAGEWSISSNELVSGSSDSALTFHYRSGSFIDGAFEVDFTPEDGDSITFYLGDPSTDYHYVFLLNVTSDDLCLTVTTGAGVQLLRVSLGSPTGVTSIGIGTTDSYLFSGDDETNYVATGQRRIAIVTNPDFADPSFAAPIINDTPAIYFDDIVGLVSAIGGIKTTATKSFTAIKLYNLTTSADVTKILDANDGDPTSTDYQSATPPILVCGGLYEQCDLTPGIGPSWGAADLTDNCAVTLADPTTFDSSGPIAPGSFDMFLFLPDFADERIIVVPLAADFTPAAAYETPTIDDTNEIVIVLNKSTDTPNYYVKFNSGALSTTEFSDVNNGVGYYAEPFIEIGNYDTSTPISRASLRGMYQPFSSGAAIGYRDGMLAAFLNITGDDGGTADLGGGAAGGPDLLGFCSAVVSTRTNPLPGNIHVDVTRCTQSFSLGAADWLYNLTNKDSVSSASSGPCYGFANAMYKGQTPLDMEFVVDFGTAGFLTGSYVGARGTYDFSTFGGDYSARYVNGAPGRPVGFTGPDAPAYYGCYYQEFFPAGATGDEFGFWQSNCDAVVLVEWVIAFAGADVNGVPGATGHKVMVRVRILVDAIYGGDTSTAATATYYYDDTDDPTVAIASPVTLTLESSTVGGGASGSFPSTITLTL